VVLDDPIERDQVQIDVIQDLEPRLRFLEEQPRCTGEHLAIAAVLGHQRDDAFRQVAFTADPGQHGAPRRDFFLHGVSLSSLPSRLR